MRADPLSGRPTRPAPVLLLATALPSPVGQGSPATHLLRRLSARGRVTIIEVGALSEEEVWDLLRKMGNVRTPTGARRFARRIHEVTGGNPFYVIELVKTLFSQKLLAVTPISREWIVPADISVADFAALPMPRSVRDAILERVSVLAEEPREVLATLAVAARPVSLDVLANVHGISRMHAGAICSRLAESHLAAEADGCFRPGHAVLGDVVRASLTEPHRSELRRVLSLALEIVTPPERLADTAGEIAWHAARAGDPDRAAAFAERANRPPALPLRWAPSEGSGFQNRTSISGPSRTGNPSLGSAGLPRLRPASFPAETARSSPADHPGTHGSRTPRPRPRWRRR